MFQTCDPPLYFITICTIHRQKIRDLGTAQRAFECYIRRVRDEFGVAVGQYVMMPDHLHFFVRGSEGFQSCAMGERVETRNFSFARRYQETAALATGLF